MQNRLYCHYFQSVAGLRDLVTQLTYSPVFAASSLDGPFARAAPALHCQVRGSNPGSRVSEAIVSDSRLYWLCDIRVLYSTFDG